VIVFLTYSSLLLSKDFINPDAQSVLYLLDPVDSIGNYLGLLFNFMTLDFQPMRDLTFLIDLKLMHAFQINFTIWQNVIWWLATCIVIYQLLKDLFPKLNQRTRFLIIVAFMVYPLFSQSIGWGMARKHILAFFFTTYLTQFWLKERDSFALKDVGIILLLYTCAVLSQAICVLWPFWAMTHLYLIKPQLLKSSIKAFIPLILIFIVIVVTNYFYYEISPVFKSNASNITRNSFDLGDKILALGHYTFQLFSPYLLVFRYTLAHWSTMVGLVILGVFALCLRGFKVEGKWAFSWAIFSFLPIAMALINPRAQYDTYILIPSLGILILLISMAEKSAKLNSKITQALLVLVILIWIPVTHSESRSWLSEYQMTRNSFKKRPSCLTAGDYLKSSYENELLGDPEAKQFLYKTDCEIFDYSGKNLIILQTLMLFYENDLPFDKRIEVLERLSSIEFYPHSVLAALYVKEKKFTEADDVIHRMEEKFKGVRYKKEYSPIIAKYLAPYCVQTNKEECIHITKGFTSKNPGIFYK
jgi:hypothetical protein